MNAICCALMLQPVRWHTPKRTFTEERLIEQAPEIDCHYCQSLKKKSLNLFSSQYLYNADDYYAPGYEIIDPGTSMLAKGNDGWFTSSSAKRSLYGSKLSLASRRMNENDSRRASSQNLMMSNRPSYANLGTAAAPDGKQKRPREIGEKIIESPSEDCPSYKSPQDLADLPVKLSPESEFTIKSISTSSNSRPIISREISETKYLKDNRSNRSMNTRQSLTRRRSSNAFNTEREILNVAKNKLEEYMNVENERMMRCQCDALRRHKRELKVMEDTIRRDEMPKFTLWEKIFIFFDLDLLRDWSYINIMVGITIANFSELNFSVLTPFVLAEFGLSKSQTAFCMSLLGLTDLSVRFFIPFIAGFIGWENRTFFLFGVMGMALGRIGKKLLKINESLDLFSFISVLAHFHSYHVALVAFLWIGFNKGLRTVFLALCIPSHVPLDRLPSATGLHLLFSGLFYIFMGPVVGK